MYETQKTTDSQDNPKKGEQSWRSHISWFQTILQNYSNQNSNSMLVVVVQSLSHVWLFYDAMD